MNVVHDYVYFILVRIHHIYRRDEDDISSSSFSFRCMYVRKLKLNKSYDQYESFSLRI